MADSKLCATGTMKASNVNKETVSFIPETLTECVFDHSTNESIITKLLDTEESIESASAGNGVVKVLHHEPDSSVYEDSPNERLFILMDDPNVWKFTVESIYGTTDSGYPSTGYYSAVPFNLYNRTGASIAVDWGDGTTSTLTNSTYSYSTNRPSIHKYTQDSAPALHQITVTSPDFSKTALMGAPSFNSANAISSTITAFRQSLASIDTPIPKTAGIYVYAYNATSTPSLTSNSLSYLFYNASKLKYICSGAFDRNPNATDFSRIFSYSGSLAPKLNVFPTRLFKCNENATKFVGAFEGRNMKRLPEDLFKYTSKPLSLSYVFRGSNLEWNPLDDIPASLFWYNKNLTSLNNINLQCNQFEICIGSPVVSSAIDFMETGTNISRRYTIPELDPRKRIVYVPKGSTTQNTFNKIAEAQKLTVIGV